MAEHLATVSWERRNEAFVDNRYSRAHEWGFDGGLTVPASASPHVVRPPMSDPHAVDPEEAFVASLASCHMLWFLSLAARRGFRVESYRDEAVGLMEKNADGRLAITTVTLRPHVVFGGDTIPAAEAVDELHHAAHHECYIATSVRSEIQVEPRMESRHSEA
ncbi:MAG TPA: OsmC family protein [Gemmatimonadota bacterium]|nr:OsmC family protein [Gemmatimonadota bacterium]